MKMEHSDEGECIPDGYKLSINFQSCLANNMNTAVFQYYVDMDAYENYTATPPGDTETGTIQNAQKNASAPEVPKVAPSSRSPSER